MINNSKQKNKMNYLEKIQQSISVQNSHPSSTINIKDIRHQPIPQSDSNYQQDQQDSSLSVVVMKTAHNNLESDIFRGIFKGGVEEGWVGLAVGEGGIRGSQDSNEDDNKENIQIGDIININQNKFIKKTVKSKSKVPIFEQIQPLAKYTSIDDSDSNPSSSQSTPPNHPSPFFTNLYSIPSKTNQDLQSKTCNTSKPSYLKFGDSPSMNKLSCFQSQILNENCKNQRNIVTKYENCKNLLLKEIQKNRELSDKVVVFGRENEELRGIICQIVGKEIGKGDSISKKSKKKMNRVTTQKTQSNFAIQSDFQQQKTALHSNLRKTNPTESKKYSQKVIKTELGPIKRQNHQKLTKKTIKQLASVSRNKTVEQLFKKVDRFQLLLNQIMQNNQLPKSSFNFNKDKQKEKERGFACLKESVKLNERGENEMQRTLVKKKFSSKKKRIKTQI